MQYIIMIATLAILIGNALYGIKRGFFRGLLRLGTILLAMVGAFYLSRVLSGTAVTVLEPWLNKTLSSNASLAELLEENPAVLESVGALARMLVTPLLFFVCYVLLKPVTWLIYFVIRSVFRIRSGHGLLERVAGGAAMGLLMGLVGVLVFVTPVMGYTDVFSRTVAEAPSVAEKLDLAEYNEKYLVPASVAPVASTLYDVLGDKIFDGLTSATLNDTETDLKTEWFAVIGVVNEAGKLGKKPVAEYGATESDAVHAMAAGVGNSQLLSSLGSGAISGIASSWLRNEPFIGVARPEIGDESIDVILNGFLTVLATTSPGQISKDLDCFADLFDLFIKYEVFSKIGADGSTDALVTHLATSGFLTDARRLLTENQRMEPVITAISDAGMRLLVRELGDPATYMEEHKDLMDGFSGQLKGCVDESGKLDAATLSVGIKEELAKQNVTVPEAATDIIAEGLADEFADENIADLSNEEITDRLIKRFGSVENISQFYGAQDQIPVP